MEGEGGGTLPDGGSHGEEVVRHGEDSALEVVASLIDQKVVRVTVGTAGESLLTDDS